MELIQNTAEWLQVRKNHVGASDAPIIMGTSRFKTPDGRYKTPLLLWQEKLGLVSFDETEAMAYGKRMEEPARQAYEKMTGVLVTPEVIFHKDVAYSMASLDGLSMEKDMAVEIKNANAADHSVARQKRVPEHYLPQVQHQLDCLRSIYGIDRMHYFSFHQGEGVVVDVRLDEDYIGQLREKEGAFWHCVEMFEEPELCDLDYREGDEEWQHTASKLWEIEERVREDSKLAKAMKDKLKMLSDGLNSRCGELMFTCSTRKGLVDYGRIPELSGVDLDKYRKSPVLAWSLKKRG